MSKTKSYPFIFNLHCKNFPINFHSTKKGDAQKVDDIFAHLNKFCLDHRLAE